MRTASIVATLIMAVASLANAGTAPAVSISDHPTIEVSPSVRSTGYYLAHRAERDRVLALCQFSRVTHSSWRACVNAREAALTEIARMMPICCGLAE